MCLNMLAKQGHLNGQEDGLGSQEEGKRVSTKLPCGISVRTMLRVGKWKAGFWAV